MRNILITALCAFVILGTLSSCSTTVKTDSGRSVTTGVHTR